MLLSMNSLARKSWKSVLIVYLLICMLMLFSSSGFQTAIDRATKYLRKEFSAAVKLCPKQIFLNATVPFTAKGPKSYEEILRLVYEPFGYEYDEVNAKNCSPNSILFPLKYKHFECSQVFNNWLNVQTKSDIAVGVREPPPREIKENERDFYLLNGFSQLKARYLNEIDPKKAKKYMGSWTDAVIKQYFSYFNSSNWNALTYGHECAAVFFAFQYFKPSNLTGMVIGTQQPWVESAALYHGARKLITAEYAPLDIQVSSIEYVHPLELVKNWKKYGNMDFIVSFSSIEHSGLGRYGDPPDPVGDLREMSKILCLLKQGGLLYLGLPSGPDTVEYNVHRVYGYIRWPMIAAGFEFLAAFYSTNPVPYDIPPPILSTDYHKQFLFVLRKK